MNIKERIAALRKLMAEKEFDAYIMTGSDPHQSEIPPDRWQVREWISGFTGSAGTVVVTKDGAGLWTDFRYFLQAGKQLEGSGITLFKVGVDGVPEPVEWLMSQLGKGSRVAVNAEEISAAQADEFEEKLNAVDILFITSEDLVDILWKDRPPIPRGKVFEVPVGLAGMSRARKISTVRSLAASGYSAGYVCISTLDDIAWTLNLRGEDILQNMLFAAYLLIGPEQGYLFCDREKIPEDIARDLEHELEILPYRDFFDHAANLIPEGSRVQISREASSARIYRNLETHAVPVDGRNITTLLKSRKNAVEIEGMRRVHLQDGAAMSSFLCWFEKHAGRKPLNEIELENVLLACRKKGKDFIRESFPTISAFGENGALCHYKAREESASSIEERGLLVLDSGGQYWGGTTDITRTLPVGKPTQEEKQDYTLVLKGHLAVARQKFPVGTRGYQLDTLARSFLWNHGKNYGHGTGHGIGFMLNVHEGPHTMRPSPVDVAFERGMIISNEPGLYREGLYGIRIENLLTVTSSLETEFGSFLEFEDLTRCPYERELIDVSLLTGQEVDQIDRYHKMVFQDIGDMLQAEERIWLERKTLPLVLE